MDGPNSTSSSSKLGAILVTTSEGATYLFPDVALDDRRMLKKMMPESGRLEYASFTIVNVSGATLLIPMRIIKTIHLEQELLWESPA